MKSTKKTLAILLFAVLALSVLSVSAFAKVCTHPNIEHKPTVVPTCTSDGSREYWYCPDCGYYFDSAACENPVAWENIVIPHPGHILIKLETVQPTCTTEGYTTYECKTCKMVFQLDKLPAFGHVVMTKNAKAATCTENGYTGDRVCKVCDALLSSGQLIAKTGHDWTDWQTIRVPYCVEDGLDIRTCNWCGAEEERTVPATGIHQLTVVNAKEATETEKGYTGDTVCTRCGLIIEKGKIIPEKGALTPDTPEAPDQPINPDKPVLPGDSDKADINARAAMTGNPELYKALRASIDFLVSFVTVILPGLLKMFK